MKPVVCRPWPDSNNEANRKNYSNANGKERDGERGR